MTFAGYPSARERDEGRPEIAIIGVPADLGVSNLAGQRQAPAFIRAAGTWNPADSFYDTRTGFDYDAATVSDWGDIDMVWGNHEASMDLIESTFKAVHSLKQAGTVHNFVALGGDDSINLPILRAMDEPPFLVHLDAHHDYYGNENRAPKDHGTWVGDAINQELVSGIYQIGIRALGPGINQRDNVFRNYLGAFDVLYAADFSMTKLRREFDRRLSDKRVYLVVDIDVVDPAFAPGTGIPEPGGLTSRELLRIVRMFAPISVGMSITEVLPALDRNGITSLLANRAVLEYIQGASTRH